MAKSRGEFVSVWIKWPTLTPAEVAVFSALVLASGKGFASTTRTELAKACRLDPIDVKNALEGLADKHLITGEF